MSEELLDSIVEGLRARSADEKPVFGFTDFQMKLAAEYVLDAVADVIEQVLENRKAGLADATKKELLP